MPNQQINSITSATTTDGSELLPVVSGGVTKSVSVSTINSGIAADAVSDVYEARDLAVGQSSIAAAAALAAGSIAQQDLTAVSAALHRSPNAVTSMFVYDTTKDSDGGAWTEKCQHTSWYNEPLSGKWLGAKFSEIVARVGTSVGTELMADSSFTNGITGWGGTGGGAIEWDNGRLKVTNVSGYGGGQFTLSGLTVGKTYLLSVDALGGTAPQVMSAGSNDYNPNIYVAANSAVGAYVFIATATTLLIRIGHVANTTGLYSYFDNVSVKEVTGFSGTSGDYYQSTTDGKFYRLWKNLYKYSQQFDISPWVTNNTATVSANVATAPDGTQTADALYETTTTSSHYVMQDAPVIAGLQYTVQFRVAPNGRTRVAIAGTSSIGGGIGAGIFFELIGVGSVIGTPAGTATIKQDAAGFYLISYTWTAANTGAYSLGVFLVDSGTQTSYTGDPTKGVYLWGAQFEQNSTATSYELKTVDGTISEVFRGNKREFPKLSAFIEESGSLTIYDLTEAGRPMWMRFDKAGSFRMPMGIGVANGTFSGYNGVSAIQIVSFCYDSVMFINSSGNYLYGNIANRNLTTFNAVLDSTTKVLSSNSRAYKTYVYATPQSTSIGGDALPNATVFNLNNATIDVFRSNGSYVTLGGASTSNSLGLPVRIRNSDFLYLSKFDAGATKLYYLNNPELKTNNPTNLIADISTSEFGRAGLPVKFISDDSSKFYKFVSGYPLVETNQINISEPTKTISSAITNTYNTGHMVGDIRRTYLADTAVGSVYSPALTMQNMITTAQQGVWYDPSDINLSWRRNLLTYTEQFDNAVWNKFTAGGITITVTANAGIAPDGSTTADRVTSTGDASVLQNGGARVSGTVYTMSMWVKRAGSTNQTFRLGAGNGTSQDFSGNFTATNEWQRFSFNVTATGGGSGIYDGVTRDSSNNPYDILVWGAQLELGSTATPYQRITDGIQDYLQYQAQPVLYRDAAGTQPVTAVEQPVGLMLDKSKGLVLGPELGASRNLVANWAAYGTNTVVQDGDAIRVTYVDNVNGAYVFLVGAGITTGKRYKITFEAKTNTGSSVTLKASDGSTDVISAPLTDSYQTFTYYSNYLTGSMIAGLTNGSLSAGEVYWVRNISVRELPGNHAFNSSGNSANFPVLSDRYNLLTKTEDFSDAVWTKQAGTTVSSTKVAAPDGTLTAFSVTGNGTSGIYQAITGTLSLGQSVRSVYLRVPTGTATVGIKDPVLTQGTTTCNLTTSWQRFTLTETTPPNSGLVAGIWISNIPASGIEVAWPDLRVANDALNQPAYQRVNTSTDYDTVGFKPYLKFNGSSQWMQTNSIDFTATDKMFVSAGVRKLGGVSTIAELSSNVNINTGTFALWTSSGSSGNANCYGTGIRGSAVGYTDTSALFSPPRTDVVTALYDTAAAYADQQKLRINSSQVTLTNFGASAGNVKFGSYPLFIGSRGGTTNFINGRIYQMVIVNKIPTADELKSTETTINRKTLAYAEQ